MNYYDGAWRPVTDTSDAALDKLRARGFVFGADEAGRLTARWPVAPAAPAGVSIRHSHGRYYATDGAQYGRWAATEEGALTKWDER